MNKTRSTWRTALRKLHIQTADKIIQPAQDLVTFIKKRKANIRSKPQEEFGLPGNKKDSRVLCGRKLTLLLHKSGIESIKQKIQSSAGETGPIATK